jgi:ATP-dependent Lhr-like helicase
MGTKNQAAMMNSQSSNSEDSSRNFERLDARIQRWIWASGWTELRDAQERAIPPILAGDRDVIIAASTASGKTEAAFLPILTRLGENADEMGLALYVSPLKALINDQWQRLDDLCASLEIPVTPWHGDISATLKRNFFSRPIGCLLITPESLEAMLMRHGSSLGELLGGLRFVVIDELHAFMGSERGKQLQSQLHRVERIIDRTVPRIGLSATLGDINRAKEFLRQGAADQVELIEAREGGQELKVLIRGVIQPAAAPDLKGDSEETPDFVAKAGIVADLYKCLRGSNNLVFPNSRSSVEFFADRLRRKCEEERVPNEFWPHHGNLSKELREQTEAALKQKERPATAICTSTLELGIDIGSVKSVAQIGPPPSVASLRQRLGRSGRRKGESAILRGYAIERQISCHSDLSDQLRECLVQSAAMVRLLTHGWYEPIGTSGLHASTLVQQTLSLISQFGGLRAHQLWEMLCVKGAFRSMPQELFASLLRGLGSKEIIFQDATGLILLAPKGEQIAEHYSFYAAFSSQEEFRIVADGRTLGSMPVTHPLAPGGFIIFGGRRWQVISVSQEELLIVVRPGAAGALPSFEGGAGAQIHDRVREEMREILRGADAVPFLDRRGQQLLEEARNTYRHFNLDRTSIRQAGNAVQLLLWRGDRIHDTIALMLQFGGLGSLNQGIYVEIKDTTVAGVLDALRTMVSGRAVGTLEIASKVKTKFRQKWDVLLPDDVLDADFAASTLDLEGALAAMQSCLAENNYPLRH